MQDPYCYENTEVLINKLGIRNEDELEKAEVDFSCNAIHELVLQPLKGSYNFNHYCQFNRYILGDIYEWAGQPRTVEMEKAEAVLGYMSIEYSKPNNIAIESEKVLGRMKERDWSHMDVNEQAELLAEDMAELWKIHAFREGNTRTTITFFCQFADEHGMHMNRELFEQNAAYTRTALVAASAIYTDGDFRKPEYLQNIIKGSLEKGKEDMETSEQE